jgi:hypothetical protein
MKSVLIAVFILIQFALAQGNDCTINHPSEQIIKLASEISLPNCVTEANVSAAKSNDPSKLCDQCKKTYESRNDSKLIPLSKEERKEIFVEAALKEYKKNITNSLVDTLKLRSLRPTGSEFKVSTAACKMKTKADLPKSCSPSAMKIIGDKKLLNNLNSEIQNELAKIISTEEKFSPQPTLLKRSAPKCYIPEKDALYISSSAAEESLSPALIEALLSMDPAKYRSTSSMFMSEKLKVHYDGKLSELFLYLTNHPLMGDHFKSPAALVAFLKTIPEPKDTAQLRSTIYNKKSGDEFDAKMSSACKLSFDSLVKNICDQDFEKGNFELSPFTNESKLLKAAIIPSEEKLAATDNLIKLNSEVLKLCENTNQSKINFSSFDTEINSSLPKRYQSLNLEQFKQQKYDSDIGNISNNICSSKDKECSDNSILCKMISKFKAVNDPKSVDYKLANSSNKEVNQLLRSMIGDTSKIDVKTKDILVAQGIIPKEDGTIINQPDIPERRPDFFQKEQVQQQISAGANLKPALANNSSNAAKTVRYPGSESSPFDQGYSNVNTKSSLNNMPDLSDLMDDQQELRGIQEEIKRRLQGFPENKLANLNDARKIVRDSFNSRGKKLTPELEDTISNRMLLPQDAPPHARLNNLKLPNDNSENRASVSGGENANTKWRRVQDQAALMGMQGAQQVLARDNVNINPISGAGTGNKLKDMTKVALNITDDPKINLADMFNKKIDQNDPETQLLKVLLKNKNNFLLQVKAMNFKIIFDEKNNLNIFVESGDAQEAARIQPQLEMFLKKLKV